MLIGDFITDYVCNHHPQHQLGTHLLSPILDKVFEMIPEEHQLDAISAGATGPFGLHHANIYQHSDVKMSLSDHIVQNVPHKILTIYFIWDNCQLYIAPDTALLVENQVVKPVITNRDNLIELTRETELQYLADYIISRVGAKKLEGEY